MPRTIIFSTHLIEEMAPLLQHIFVLARGKLVLDSETGALDGYAYTISGARGAVQRALDEAAAAPLASRTVGGLATATLRGPVPQGLAASAPGLAIEPATLQQIISALGQDPSDTGPDALADAITEGSRS